MSNNSSNSENSSKEIKQDPCQEKLKQVEKKALDGFGYGIGAGVAAALIGIITGSDT